MRNRYEQVLKSSIHHKLFRTRVKILNITQEEMVHRLALSARSYVELDHRKTSYSGLTLALFLVYVSNDPYEFLEEPRYAFETVRAKAS